MHLSHIGPISCNIFTSVSHDLDFVSSTEAFGMIKSEQKLLHTVMYVHLQECFIWGTTGSPVCPRIQTRTLAGMPVLV